MNIGIDASNIRGGGGKKHIEDFIIYSSKLNSNIKFTVVSNKNIIKSLSNLPNVNCITNKLLNLSNITSFLSQILYSKNYFKKNNCKVVFVPGGIFLSMFRPYVTMSQNMLPFEYKELSKFGNIKRLKFILLKYFQLNTFKRSNGIIFLTEFAKDIILPQISAYKKNNIIPHGIEQKSSNSYNYRDKPFNLLYVSDFLPYKNQFKIIKATENLISKGYDLSLTLAGSITRKDHDKIKKILACNPKLQNRLNVLGHQPPTEIVKLYKKCSIFLFASTCENLPFIMLEAMSYGLPILTTNKSPMKDLAFNKGMLFNVEEINSIENTIIKNMDAKKLVKASNVNFHLSKNYKINTSVNKTLKFIISSISMN